MKRRRKAPLYRKVNTKARNVHHHFGGDYKSQRRSPESKDSSRTRQAMSARVRRGLDYTPLYRFLLSKVGNDWDRVFAEASSRLDTREPIFHLVALSLEQRTPVVRCGESSYYSGLYVDENKVLRIVAPELGPEDIEVSCACCTHTFNGKAVPKKFRKD